MRITFKRAAFQFAAVSSLLAGSVSASERLPEYTTARFSPATFQQAMGSEGPSNIQLTSCCADAGCACDAASDCAAPGCDPCSACNGVTSCDACGVCDPCSGCDSCDGCGCGLGLGLGDKLFGLLEHSDRCFPCFVSPMTNPVFFEDPRTLTEARLIFLNHKVPGGAGGGNVKLVACQLRAALTDRLSVIATKDGFIMSSNPLIDDGWADISAGLKYNLIVNPSVPFLYSVGATYEMPVGTPRALQGNGDGQFHLFGSMGTQVGAWNWLFGHGLVLPADSLADASFMYLSTHLSRRISSTNLYFVTEFNWYNWVDSGGGGIPGVEGGDLFSLGSTNVTGNDIVTGAFGFKYKPRNNMELGIAWENPLTDRRDVLSNRLTVDAIIRY